MRATTNEVPAYHWDGAYWTTTIAFREWPKNLAVPVEITSPSSAGADEPSPPNAEQASAIARLERPRARATLGALLLEAARAHHAACVKRGFENDDGTALAPLRRPADLNGLVSLQRIQVHDVAKAGSAYVGLVFACGWDREHGFGAMVHGERVVQAGGADVAILEWIATRDGGARIGAEPAAPRAATSALKRPAGRKAAPRRAVKKAAVKKRTARQAKRS